MSKFSFLILLVLALAVGYWMGHAPEPSADPSHGGHAHGPGGSHEAGHEDHGPEPLTPQALKNIGVELGVLDIGEAVATRRIPARLELDVHGTRPLTAPVAGVVTALHVDHAQVVKAGVVAVEMLQDPLSPVEFTATAPWIRGEDPLRGLRLEDLDQNRSPEALRASMIRAGLSRSGLWSSQADGLLTVLKATGQSHRTALVGELAARDLVDQPLVEWVASSESARRLFERVAALRLAGNGVERLRWLETQGALGETVRIPAPADELDWDVTTLHVKPGQRVRAGDPLVTLENPRHLLLDVPVRGAEITALMSCATTGQTLRAVPAVAGSGPALDGLRVLRIHSGHDGLESTGHILVHEQGSHVANIEGRDRRTWNLRPGTAYVIELPVRRFEEAYVVPAEALVDTGAESVLLLPDGDGFREVPVEVLYRGDTTVILGPGSDVFPGDPYVARGAFALRIALHAGDAQGGHGHAH